MAEGVAERRQDDTLVLLGRRSDLLQLQGQADLPPRFLALFEGGLEATAGVADDNELDGLLRHHAIVGLDAELLGAHPDDDERRRRYRDNLAQKLAARRVVLLTVLRDCEFAAGGTALELLRGGELRGERVACQPAKQTLSAWREQLQAAGFVLDVVAEGGEGAATVRLHLAAATGTPLVAARDVAPGGPAELFEFAADGPRETSFLRSRPFDAALARRPDAGLIDVLRDCARRQEQEALDRVLQAWGDATASMQADTRARTQLELVVVATRAIGAVDQQRIERFANVGRIWCMTDRLRAGGDQRTLVRARHVWPDAVGALLARLCLGRPEAGARGMFAWRSFLCAVAADAAEIERRRAAATMRILDDPEDAATEVQIERKGPFAPITAAWQVARAQPDGIRWGDTAAAAAVEAACAEPLWVEDHRSAGTALGRERMQIERALADGDGQDPERVHAQQYWAKVHRSPGQLRVFAAARLFRADESMLLHKRLPEHLQEWREDVLDARRELARSREALRHRAEEFDRAQRFHIAISWRLLIAAAVSAYAGFLSLHVLRVLLTFQPSTLATGVWIFAAAVAGGWLGAFLPMWGERLRGQAAAAALSNELAAVDAAQRTAVAETHEVFRDAENLRQTVRITAIHRRTTLLADRAWTIVSRARDAAANAYERRRLLGQQVGSGDAIERLADEDRREWRAAAVLRAAAAAERSVPEDDLWRRRFAEVAQAYRRKWHDGLAAEDPRRTGHLRAAVLTRLVHELADDVGDCIERELLAHAERDAVAAGSAAAATAWIERMRAAVGLDAADHALLSVLDDGAAQRTAGAYRIYRRPLDLADQVCRGLRGMRQGFADVAPVVVDTLPLGGFAMVFHEVPLTWRDGRLALDESAAHDLPGAEAPA
jgi:hypothetical protein